MSTRPNKLLIITACIFITFSCSLKSKNTETINEINIHGIVLDEITLKPVPDMSVVVERFFPGKNIFIMGSFREVNKTITDKEGRFVFRLIINKKDRFEICSYGKDNWISGFLSVINIKDSKTKLYKNIPKEGLLYVITIDDLIKSTFKNPIRIPTKSYKKKDN